MLRVLAILLLLTGVAAGDVVPHNSILLLGQWTFDKGDARDSSIYGANGVAEKMTFEEGCAVFDGSGYIELALRPADLKLKLRTVEVEIRAKFNRPQAYYNTLLSHPFFQVAVHSLGTGKGHPCFACDSLKSDLAPDPEGDTRWGKGPRLTAGLKERFYYWGWIGDASSVVPANVWVNLRTVYDGKQVTQYLDGKIVGTHPILEKGVRVGAREGTAPKAFIGKSLSDTESEHLFAGRIDSIRIRATR